MDRYVVGKKRSNVPIFAMAEPPKKRSKLTIQNERKHVILPLPKSINQNIDRTPILQLPNELLLEIFGNINVWHYNHIRSVCNQFCDVLDSHIVLQLKKTESKKLALDQHGLDGVSLKVINLITEIYIHSGLDRIFCGSILPMLKSTYRDPFTPQMSMMNDFIASFFTEVEIMYGDKNEEQLSCLFYCLTLIRVLRNFQQATILMSSILPLHWSVSIEIKGTWMGMLWSPKQTTKNKTYKHINLMVVLTELLIFNLANQAVRHVWESDNEIYVFGNDLTESKRAPRTIFTFTLVGSKNIRALFNACILSDFTADTWPDIDLWPREKFSLNLDISCREAVKWGCAKVQHIELSPCSDLGLSDDDDEERVVEVAENLKNFKLDKLWKRSMNMKDLIDEASSTSVGMETTESTITNFSELSNDNDEANVVPKYGRRISFDNFSVSNIEQEPKELHDSLSVEEFLMELMSKVINDERKLSKNLSIPIFVLRSNKKNS